LVQFWYRHRKDYRGVLGKNKDLGAVWYSNKMELNGVKSTTWA
jgi:hypothetical protein